MKIDNGELHKSVGILKYGEDESGFKKITVLIDANIYFYYRSLIPKYFDVQRQKHEPHISIVRKENIKHGSFWGKYEGDKIEFYYSNHFQNGEIYWWLNTFSVHFEKIRSELGLSVKEHFTKPPEGFNKTFHITLGNMKN